MGNLTRHILILIMLSLSFPALSFAQKKVAFIVGGVEAEKSDTTMFDADFFNMTWSLLRQNYEVHAFFNGDSKITIERYVKPLQKFKNFTWAPANYNLLFPLMAAQKLTQDDKLIVVMIGHGSSAKDSKFHSLTTQKDTSLTVESMDIILNSKGLKQAQQVVIDSSCFSGHSMMLAAPNRCVLSSSKADTLGYYNFLQELANSIKTSTDCWFCSKDVLSTFLRIRGKVRNSSPMISSFSPADDTLKAIYKISSYYLTVENYLYFMTDKGFCRRCYINAYSTFEKQIEEVIKNFQLQQKFLPRYLVEGLVAEINEFNDVQKEIVDLAKTGDNSPAVDAKAKVLIGKGQALYQKMVTTERNLYEGSMHRAVYLSEIKRTDPCLNFRF